MFLNAWFWFWNFMLEIPTGTVADFLGRKISLVMGGVISIIGVLVYVSYPAFWVFMTADFIFAIAFTLISGADEALIYDSLIEIDETESSKKVYARMESFKLGGIVVGATAGGFIAKSLGLRWPLLLTTIPLGVSVIFALTLKEPEIHEEKPVLKFKTYKKILVDGFKYFWHNKVLKILALDMVFVFAVAWIIIWFYQALLARAGVDIKYFGFVHAFLSLSQIVIINNFIRLEKWLGSKKRLLFLGAFITGACFIILGLTAYVPLVIACILLSGGFGLSRLPLFSSYMNKYIPSDKRATVLSTTSMLRTFAIVIVNTTAGLLSDWSIPNTLLILGAAAILFAFISRVREEHLID
jgi:MFS family permease